jgi:putative transposase
MPPTPPPHHRHSLRLRGYDYAQPGAYFVTICAWQRQEVFGRIEEGQMQLNEWGQVAAECWATIPAHFAHVTLDEWTIMPNHMHGILVITVVGARQCRAPTDRAPTEQFGHPVSGSIPTVIRSCKSAVTKRINVLRNAATSPIWQRNYYEHIVRNQRELAAIRAYIHNNPAQWALDRDNAANGLPEAASADDYLGEVDG